MTMKLPICNPCLLDIAIYCFMVIGGHLVCL